MIASGKRFSPGAGRGPDLLISEFDVKTELTQTHDLAFPCHEETRAERYQLAT